jgi:N-sulfoglucosamine sulfohydrolase
MIGMAATGMTASSSSAKRLSPAGPRPNILYIIVHDLGTALSCYGHPNVKTPRLDQFASENARFTNYFCCSTPCSPSRGCIMTGRYAHTNGLMGLAHIPLGWSLPENERTVVDYLNDAGYETVNIGGQHERYPTSSPSGNPNRFRQVGPVGRKANLVADDVCRFLRGWKRKNGPFYLNVYSQDPHDPWDRPEFQGRYAPGKITPPAFLPNTTTFRSSLAQFYGSVSFTDEAIGRIFDTLRQTGLEEDTLVIFTTDHGIAFPRAKNTLYDPGVTTALLVRWPGRIKPGTVNGAIIGNVDLLPTMLDLIVVPIPKEIQGRSFAPLLTGGTYTPNEQVFAERNFSDFDPVRCVRTTRYKLIRNYVERDQYKLPKEATEEDTRATMRKTGRPRPFEELYDLESDPNEFENVAEDRAHAGVLEDLRRRLDAWMRDTGDYMRGARELLR